MGVLRKPFQFRSRGQGGGPQPMPRQTFHDDLSLKLIIFDQDDLSVAIHAEFSFALPLSAGVQSCAAYTSRGDSRQSPRRLPTRFIGLFPKLTNRIRDVASDQTGTGSGTALNGAWL